MTMTPNLDFQNVSLALCLTVCATLSYFTVKSPNPPPKNPYPKDRLAKKMATVHWRRYALMSLWCYHILLTLFPENRSSFCLNPDLLNKDLFTWSSYTVVFVIAVLVAAPIRLLCFAQLGENFTFELAKPKKLIQTGFYRYVQHPSYPPLLVILTAIFVVVQRPDAAPACFMPSALVRMKGVTAVAGFFMVGLEYYSLAQRVQDEEEMLRQEFGKEWEAYSRKTKRFIPGIW
ncbi:uncharacterized protein L3040_001873 [Drepanopeziza brunnea f. sp. 'multigermtubi']|uniref:Protein-S-isoprenylcysteine O-methyltransferase n=1 Tax=Marssonina brunnea f. sp. multigermtubi (strain MB_m1) TaxID=1072389 RepID=K1X435_MARBU|nr:isoprenylcysteine carboxyl methyltransferase [Drepanopeziza brunnea f. sp. 'multigermtubi' MB_m1]EKD19782.1 isoprenylcysteine carboxyl methyltransferase [Drepanopeziza brunnea f. sp. 'multigermtubi' MB_m1]KAJ5052114.1 hypothetical protein L3040_001873 [Drepanopeziza brunnea f. sp. 'multigermtubi']